MFYSIIFDIEHLFEIVETIILKEYLHFTQTEREARLIENLAATNFASKITEEDMVKIGSLNLNLRKFHEPYKMP